MNQKTSRILVTGASGNLGSALIQYLSELGYNNITASCRYIPEDFPVLPGVKWESLDILDIVALEDIMNVNDIVIHCAGKVCYQPAEKAEIYKINIEGTANVVNTANAAGIKKFIHISSTAALGIPIEQRIINEEYTPDPTQFITDYAISKWFGELEVWRSISEGLNAIIISPSVILIPNGEHTNTGVYIRQLKNGLRYYPSGSTGFVAMQDVVKAIELLIQSDIQEEKFILNASNKSWKDFFKQLVNDLSLSQTLSPVPTSYLTINKFINHFRRLLGKMHPLPTAVAKQMMQDLKYDGFKMTTISGFTYTPIDETIKAYTAPPN